MFAIICIHLSYLWRLLTDYGGVQWEICIFCRTYHHLLYLVYSGRTTQWNIVQHGGTSFPLTTLFFEAANRASLLKDRALEFFLLSPPLVIYVYIYIYIYSYLFHSVSSLSLFTFFLAAAHAACREAPWLCVPGCIFALCLYTSLHYDVLCRIFAVQVIIPKQQILGSVGLLSIFFNGCVSLWFPYGFPMVSLS